MTIKTIWVEAPFMEYGYWSTDQVEVGSKTVKVEKGIFSKRFVEEQIPIYEKQKVWHSEGYSDKEMDGKKFTKRIEKAIADLEKGGFEVINIIPLISGRYKNDYSSSPNMSFGWGYGFSYTEGVTILAKSKK